MSAPADRLQLELQMLFDSGVTMLPRSPVPEAATDPAAEGESKNPALTLPESPAPPAKEKSQELKSPGASPALKLSLSERSQKLESIAGEIQNCTKCRLCDHRTHAVPGEGAMNPPILFIGEGPGADEDRSGRPFVGRAGQLLDKMIAAIGLQRSEVYIANIVKCRPPNNRTPEMDEVKQCLPYLEEQIDLLQPALICTLGLPSTRTLVPGVKSISAVRGRPASYRGIPLVPTFHPAYLLRNPSAKHQTWADLKLVAKLALGKEIQ